MSDDTFQRLLHRYQNQETPWDSPLPPPEVQTLVPTLSAGRALDLGCGYGRAAIYLAQHGWQVDAIDFIPLALEEAQRRALAANVTTQITFHQASVAQLHFLTPPYQFALDVGCLHALNPTQQTDYAHHLNRLLAPQAIYLLFARIIPPTTPPTEDGPRGLLETTIRNLFTPHFTLTRLEHGHTTNNPNDQWSSAWFWWQKNNP
ncbi:MAG TPA: class I SAM-dependent methyltransferase [Anaerolineae bacterium]|nr:class I SAM-dependent methyltransferase [Anaerolineae bacterium]